MNLINLNVLKGAAASPLLVLIDPQKEYTLPDRPLALTEHELAIANCRQLVRHARLNGIPIAFVRWTQVANVFNPQKPASSWIEGLEPLGSDMVFDRVWPSAYASEEFATTMADGRGADIAVAGFTGSIACLATIVEGSQRQHRLTFIRDASHSHAIDTYADSEARAHEMATAIISLFGRVETTTQWIQRTAYRQKQFDGGGRAF